MKSRQELKTGFDTMAGLLINEINLITWETLRPIFVVVNYVYGLRLNRKT